MMHVGTHPVGIRKILPHLTLRPAVSKYWEPLLSAFTRMYCVMISVCYPLEIPSFSFIDSASTARFRMVDFELNCAYVVTVYHSRIQQRVRQEDTSIEHKWYNELSALSETVAIVAVLHLIIYL